MKKPLPLLLAALTFIMLQQQSFAQVTLVSSNTYINTGFVLPAANRPIMSDTAGGIWTTDGITATKVTTAVTRVDTLGSAFYNNKIYFAGADAITKDIELWASDGTVAGTQLIANINPTSSSMPDQFFVFNNTLFFTANDGSRGRELWKSNGAVGNATFLRDINPGAGNGISQDAVFFQNGNNIFIPATTGVDTGLWKIDPSETPTLVRNITGAISLGFGNSAALGSKTMFTVRTGDIFTGATQLWATDGTTNGTVILKDFGPGSGLLGELELTPFNGVLFFDGITAGSNPLSPDIELWTTDGTATNTKLFKDLDPTGSSQPIPLASALINGKMYFSAKTTANGRELWVTNGTPTGTTLFKDINSGAGNAAPEFLINIAAYTTQISSGTGNFIYQQATSTPFNGKWYFTADNGTSGRELWSTDGTPNGTQMVKDINPGNGDGVGNSTQAYYTTSGIYFTGNNGTSGDEPFITDGTANGTTLVADINPTAGKGSNPDYLFFFNNQIYLDADNGDNTNTSGDNPDLYKIDKSVVLPVKLLNFNVALRNGGVAVNWATANEANTRSFVVERSTDGVHFNTLGTVAAAGSSNTSHQYQFTDANALQAGASTLYYRLRIVDNDGKYSYTAILPVQLHGGMFRITLSPNPVRNQLSVAFSANNAKTATLRLTDANGKVVYQQQFQTNGVTSMQQYINVSNYATGSYFVQLITDKDIKTAQFIKQ